jgi:hypothetical protein
MKEGELVSVLPGQLKLAQARTYYRDGVLNPPLHGRGTCVVVRDDLVIQVEIGRSRKERNPFG